MVAPSQLSRMELTTPLVRAELEFKPTTFRSCVPLATSCTSLNLVFFVRYQMGLIKISGS